MDPAFEKTCEIIDHDLASEWIELCTRVRQAALELSTKAQNTALAEEASSLALEIGHLTEHVERMHGDVQGLLAEMDEQVAFPENADATVNRRPEVEGPEIDQENIQIRREQHELRADFRDVLKALFLWKDDPVLRTKGKKTVV
ncbi:MAG: hypothetical protein QM680_00555 [Luteolibacter sp.]